ncbi:hypothetical protein X777_01117, partial [Ooceraea biroi]
DKNEKGFCLRILKKIIKGRKEEDKQPRRRGQEEGNLILETDERTLELLLKKGWRKCIVSNYVSVIRCYNYWGYFHIAKNCTRQKTCHKCVGNHKESECMSKKKKCVNCMHKIQPYNLKINDEHDALDPECPVFKRILEEQKRRIGWQTLSESRLTEDISNCEVNVPGYDMVRCDRGVILYIREELRYDITLQKKVNSNCWCVAIEVKEKWYKGSIAVMYHSPSAPDSVFVDYLEDITERLVLKGDCIIVGDFNINILEDSFYTKKIHTIMLGLGMKQYVDKPTRVTKDSQTIIDLIFANRKINIQVCEEPKITDHAWLQIKLKIKDLEDRYKEWWGRNYSKINVDNFVLLMEENKIQGQELCVNVKANNFVNSIVNVLDIVAPKKKFRIPKVWEGKKWYTDEIREAAKEIVDWSILFPATT